MDVDNTILEANEESARLDFKREFNPDSTADWCELIKDILAMANSGGGVIVIGVNDDGTSSDFDLSMLDGLDGAVVDDKMRKYVEQRPVTKFLKAERQSRPAFFIICEPTPFLVPFTAPGEYEIGVDKKSKKFAFAKGTIYCRHGPKSEPCEYRDIQESTNRVLEKVRSTWLEGVARITEAPIDKPAKIVIEASETVDRQGAAAVRLTDDPNAPQLFLAEIANTHPMNATQLAKAFTEKSGARITLYDVLCIRDAFELDKHPEQYLRIPGGSPRYSALLLEWMLDAFMKDKNLFLDARSTRHRLKANK